MPATLTKPKKKPAQPKAVPPPRVQPGDTLVVRSRSGESFYTGGELALAEAVCRSRAAADGRASVTVYVAAPGGTARLHLTV